VISKMPKPNMPKVHLEKIGELQETLDSCLDAVNWKSIVKPGSKVVIKVNGTHFTCLPGLTTTPELVLRFGQRLRDRAEEVIMGDSNLQRVDADFALKGCLIKPAIDKAGVKFMNFSTDKMVKVDVKGEVLREMEMPKCYTEADVFGSMPVFKTHKLTQVTLTLKNQFGCIPDDHRFVYHGKIHKVLADMDAFLKPKLVVMDGIVGLESDGPIAGIPKELGYLLTATNSVAADSVASRVMGFNPETIEHIAHASGRGLGPMAIKDIDYTGLPLEKAKNPFEPVSDDIISKLERRIAPSPRLSKLVYKSPLFSTMKWISWKIRSASGYKKVYEERVKKTGLWGEDYRGLFK
jgi:uncharacterized protein (DUF362 family)